MTDLTPLGKLVVLALLSALCAVVFCLVLGCSAEPEARKGGPAPTCAHWCAMSIGCPNDPAPDCMGTCSELMILCPIQMRALIRCQLSLSDAELSCNAHGSTDARQTECIAANVEATWCTWYEAKQADRLAQRLGLNR